MHVPRTEKINSLIQEALGEILLEEFGREYLLFTITAVETLRDLSAANVWISTRGDEKKVLAILKRNLYPLQKHLNKKLVLKKIPKINFCIDRSAAHVQKIEDLLKDAPGEERR